MSPPLSKKSKVEVKEESPSLLSLSPLHWSSRLKELIQNIEPLGSFVHYDAQLPPPPPPPNLLQSSSMMMVQPHITVEGVGRLGFPLYHLAVDALMAHATKAPYGLLDQTLIDTNVRDAWQIDATQVTIGGGDIWTSYFNNVVREHCFQLGISKERFDQLQIKANLYKMLIYEEGGHFLTHRDTEKEVNMFGTLVLQLPTSIGFTGGEFTVTHQGVTKTLDLSTGSDNEFASVSFYADCEHQLHPITSGKRVCLVYNLVAVPPEPTLIPSHNINIETENKLRLIVNDWNISDKPTIHKIGHPLEHKYSHQSIDGATLKGRDEIIFTTLQNAKDSSGNPLLRVSLLLMERYSRYYGGECHAENVVARVLIVKNDDGSYTKRKLSGSSSKYPNFWPKSMKTEYESEQEDSNANKITGVSERWDMVCFSKSGWWFAGYDNSENSDDEEDKNDDASDDDVSTYDVIPSNQQMFLAPYETRKRAQPYTGNEGGEAETWYYAAAIVISPFSDSSAK